MLIVVVSGRGMDWQSMRNFWGAGNVLYLNLHIVHTTVYMSKK